MSPTIVAACVMAGTCSAVRVMVAGVARKAHGERDGTRAIIEVLLLHRGMPHGQVVAALDAALRAGALTEDALEARKAARSPSSASRSSTFATDTGKTTAAWTAVTLSPTRMPLSSSSVSAHRRGSVIPASHGRIQACGGCGSTGTSRSQREISHPLFRSNTASTLRPAQVPWICAVAGPPYWWVHQASGGTGGNPVIPPARSVSNLLHASAPAQWSPPTGLQDNVNVPSVAVSPLSETVIVSSVLPVAGAALATPRGVTVVASTTMTLTIRRRIRAPRFDRMGRARRSCYRCYAADDRGCVCDGGDVCGSRVVSCCSPCRRSG